jgi:hypothetical protein
MSNWESNLDPQTFNNLFIEQLDGPEGMQKSAAAGGTYIKTKIREEGIFRHILPPQRVTPQELQGATDHDTLVFMRDIETDSRASAMNFTSEASERYVKGKRYAIPFYKIESEKFVKNEAELLAYKYPVTKVIEENTVKDIQLVEDYRFLGHAENAITVTGKRLPSTATAVDRKEINKLVKMIDGDKLKTDVILMNNVDWADYCIQPASEIGSGLASEITIGGYKYLTILGRRLHVTNKTDLVLPGEVWAFTAPEYLGDFLIMNDIKFWIKKEADLVMWKSWEYVGGGFGNIRSIAKIELPNVPSPIPVGGTV